MKLGLSLIGGMILTRKRCLMTCEYVWSTNTVISLVCCITPQRSYGRWDRTFKGRRVASMFTKPKKPSRLMPLSCNQTTYFRTVGDTGLTAGLGCSNWKLLLRSKYRKLLRSKRVFFSNYG